LGGLNGDADDPPNRKFELLWVFMAKGLAAPKALVVEFEGMDVVPAGPNKPLPVVLDGVVDVLATPNTLPPVEAGVVDDAPNTKAFC
jgi:hypothetical protein